jgi:CrcB protein
MIYLWIAAGSAIGGVGRYWLSGAVANAFGESFPWGTLIVNVSGSFVIGFIATISDPEGRLFLSSTARQFLTTGICGGYTTFSSFSIQTLSLLRDGQWAAAGANIAGSVFLCLLAVWLGHLAAASINALKGA